MALVIDFKLSPSQLVPRLERLFDLSADKIGLIEKTWDATKGTPVFTAAGKYTSRGWTEWTQGFQFGAPLLQYDATGDAKFLELGRSKTVCLMGTHVSHMGVHDHGFNNVSTYGNLLRLIGEGKIRANSWEKEFYALALKVSGAVQANRWTAFPEGGGFIYSFNGPHSLFIDTIRSLRSLAIAHALGHVLKGERDCSISLLERLVRHGQTTAEFAVYFGQGRDLYDTPGRCAHESLFNINDGSYRCPNSQQGYSPFTTWMRGLSWAVCGFAEQLEFLQTVSDEELEPVGGRKAIVDSMREAAAATSDFYIENSCSDGIPMWDSGAPNLHRIGNYRDRPADPFNEWEPVDSSAAAIAAQGLLRLGTYLQGQGDGAGERYFQAGLTIARALLNAPYLSESASHQGLLLHSVYHRPNGWDYIAPGQKIPNGESSMWGDYHLIELGVMALRMARGEKHHTFFSGLGELR
jgi:unsaturated chondroitin disaccharide hydrolase